MVHHEGEEHGGGRHHGRATSMVTRSRMLITQLRTRIPRPTRRMRAPTTRAAMSSGEVDEGVVGAEG